jgi:hypothetical protein
MWEALLGFGREHKSFWFLRRWHGDTVMGIHCVRARSIADGSVPAGKKQIDKFDREQRKVKAMLQACS